MSRREALERAQSRRLDLVEVIAILTGFIYNVLYCKHVRGLFCLCLLFLLPILQVDRNAKPPVCKIMDYHREKYVKKLKEKERAKSKVLFPL